MDPIPLLIKNPLFHSFQEEELKGLLQKAGAYEEVFPAGEEVRLCRDGRARVGFLLEGKATVSSRGAALNRLTAGSVFGVAQLYGTQNRFPTAVTAKTRCRALFLDEAQLDLFLSDPRFARDLVAFLTDRIRFLNRKIAAFTAPDATVRLAFALEVRSAGGDRVSVSSYSHLARELDLGRASLYRALDALERDGAIEKQGKTVRIADRIKLQKITERR